MYLFLEAKRLLAMMMTSGGLTSARTMRNSPFRESEWDRRLDHLLQDLETSVSVPAQQRSQSSERNSPTTQKVQIEVVDPTAGYSSVITRSLLEA